MASAARLLAIASTALVTLTPMVQGQSTATLTVLYNFIGSADGAEPGAALVQGSDGNFYGTTGFDGDGTPNGTAFEVTPAGVFTTLHNFTGYHDTTDGAGCDAALVQGSDGNFYGVTTGGGTSGSGTVFKMTPAGVLTILHSFAGTDGAQPSSALVQGSDGNFYGTTTQGGTGSQGTIFEITPAGVLTVLHSLSATGAEGSAPYGALVQDSNGTFYGTTSQSGANGDGTVFSITPAGAFATLHVFTGIGTEGSAPKIGLTPGSDGNFYGVTEEGGSGTNGTVFSITPAGALTTLYGFSAADDRGRNSDGTQPTGRLVQGSDGNFYGTTLLGGSGGSGTIFSITPAGVFTTLYTFSGVDGNEQNGDGQEPVGLVRGSDGNFYGTASFGGTSGYGTVFKLTLEPAFFTGEAALANGVYYLAFPDGDYFGYYSYLSDPKYIYHFDLGYEYVFDAADGHAGVYLYDFKSSTFFYTSPTFPFPYLYDFSLNTVLYYYPDPSNAGHYNTNGVRYFYDFATGKIISK